MKVRKSLLIMLFVLKTAGCLFAKQPVMQRQKDYMNSLKITFLSWISGSTKLSYERSFPKRNQSGEICASLIGAGRDKYNNDPKGYTLRYGHKFFFNEMRKCSLMGFYLRPEVVFSHYSYNSKSDRTRTLSNNTALIGTFGYQYVYRRFLVDFWAGGGYAFGQPADTYYHHGYELWHYFNTENTNVALSFSIRLGFCF